MDADKCAICNNELSSNEETFIVSQKGIDSINRASEQRGEKIIIQSGQRLHKKCRQRWINPKYLEIDRKNRSTHDEMPSCANRSLCVFNFKEHCLFCCSGAKSDRKERGVDVSHVETIEFKDRVLKVCEKVQNNDGWASTVKGRIGYVADLVSEEAHYHRTCFANFDSNKNIPKAFSSADSSEKQNLGRPEDSERKQAFLEVANYLQQNDEEQLTIVDLVKRNGGNSQGHWL
ncbi:uncharacterized protein LOC143022627 isoform X2 [Oratosquilla oratoria]|uniref:uncharacterized protein LOC143022627 isoform X2 n=1 Tax=Oratosquilla oratoria TaxID=337810 RepID=UPI003F7714D6